MTVHTMGNQRNADHGEDSKLGNSPADGSHAEQGREMTIVVSGRERTVTDKELTFDAVTALALTAIPSGENVVVTITFRRGHGDKPEGNLLPGGTVKIKDGMVFVVTATDKS